ncbi:SusC/RagA family TonB-linked outer membrane protein [uncultured Parabacteroides sp.]|uniref:SusC/RagA family TonB-linked outer membrane protein n=1 Tax=uncultured Parabacteroides sp. TaxID=512312 RepID=UPI00258CF858|nr:SusC/RagA family TonB-linked outer membrane protein [uncultured Parabacteroides sp.]
MLKNLKPVSLVLIAGALSFSGNAYADLTPSKPSTGISQQSGRLTGVVEDDFGPVAGASIVVKGTTNGTITDMNGNFTLEGVQNGATIQVSFIGYATQEIRYTGQSSLNVKLKEDSQALDEVVVTALGMKRETKALGYAVTELKGEELLNNAINPVSALQGKVAGVEIAGSDGGMFGATKIQIRGASTLGKNNQPIYVIDGVILDNAIRDGDADWTAHNYDYGNELKNLNPDDFETVSVLKGAAATALYGSRGLNGAVVITTKSGKGKQGIGVNVSQTFGIDHMFKQPKLQNKYGRGQYTGNVSYGETDANGNYYLYDNIGQFYLNSAGNPTLSGGTGRHWGPAFDGSNIENYDYSTIAYSPVENNFKDAYNLGFNSNTNVSVSGSSEKTSFYTSLSYKYASGTLPNNSFDRTSFLAKASHKITDKVEVEASISFANSNPKNAQPNIGELFVDGTWGRTYDTQYFRKRYKGSHGGLASADYGDEYGNNPGRSTWWNIYENDYSQKETSVRPTLVLNVELTDWMKFRAEGNYNYYYKRHEEKKPGDSYANKKSGYYEMGQYTKEQTNLNAAFTFNKSINDFTFGGFIRGEYYNNMQQVMKENTNGGLVVPNQYFIANSINTPSYSGKIEGEKRMLSLSFQASVSWKDQLFLDVTGRNDWSSALVYSDTHGNYSYFYPSISASWLIHETFRDQLPTWISFAKVRGSWAQVGNDTDAYTINSAYSLLTAQSQGATNVYALSIPTTAYSTNLKPERKNAWEIGLDWRFLSNRIGIDMTYYKENTKDQIMSISVPGISGINSQYINAGNIENKGLEIALNTTPFKNKDWQWDLNFTYTKNNNKIVELHPNVADYITLSGEVAYGNYRVGSVAKVGESYGVLMSDSKAKIDEKTGLPILNATSYYGGDRGMHAMYYQRSGEAEVVGSMVPDFLGSVSTSLTYKNWSLRALFDMRFGGYVASYANRYGLAYGFTESSLKWRDSENGGMTYTSIWDGQQYHDGLIPVGLVEGGTSIPLPNGTSYTVAEGGETYQNLYDKGLVDPQHASAWHYWNNAWGTGVVNDDWVKKLNYIALREITVSYRMPNKIAHKLGAQHLNLSVSGRNLGYLLNTMPNKINPESVRGTSASEFRIRSFNGMTANYTFTINVGF